MFKQLNTKNVISQEFFIVLTSNLIQLTSYIFNSIYWHSEIHVLYQNKDLIWKKKHDIKLTTFFHLKNSTCKIWKFIFIYSFLMLSVFQKKFEEANKFIMYLCTGYFLYKQLSQQHTNIVNNVINKIHNILNNQWHPVYFCLQIDGPSIYNLLSHNSKLLITNLKYVFIQKQVDTKSSLL